MREHRSGQSLSEYGLAGTLIAVAAVGGMLMLSDTTRQTFLDMLSGSKTGIQATSTGTSHAQAQTPGTQTITVTLDSGKTLTLHNYPANLQNAVETAGANGTTVLLADSIQAMADQLLELEEITPEQRNLLAAIANQGHRLAQIESLVEKAAVGSADKGAFLSTAIEFDGKLYSNPYDLAELVGTHEKQDNAARMGSEMQRFWDLYEGLYDTPLAKNDTVIKLLYGLGKQIDTVADAHETSVFHIARGTATLEELLQMQTSNLTAEDSTAICETGQGQDNGIHCSG